MTRVLALSDEVSDSLYGPTLGRLVPDLVVACGDLPFDYLEYVVTMLNVPLLYVPGNHDPDVSPDRQRAEPGELLTPFLSRSLEEPPGPQGCTNVDGRVVDAGGLRIAGLGGSIRYGRGPNQYTQAQMRRRALRLQLRLLRRRLSGRQGLDILITHAPPLGLGDGEDPAHRGFRALHWLVARATPRILVHGHVHPYGQLQGDRTIGATKVVNAVAYRCLEV
ncbi:MAG: metallophosphoesterase [Actinomycetota bacterium]